MRWIALLGVMACAGEGSPLTPVGGAEAARVAQEPMHPESDAVLPRWIREPVPLAGGASLLPNPPGHGVRLDAGDGRGPSRLIEEPLLAAPAVGGSGRRVALAHEAGDDAVLTVLDLGRDGWRSHEVLRSRGPMDRVGISADGSTLAFVWAGPDGGVSGLWTLTLPNGAPIRRTNGGARRPGGPPEGFLPLPVGAPVRVVEGTLAWTSEVGEHRVPLDGSAAGGDR